MASELDLAVKGILPHDSMHEEENASFLYSISSRPVIESTVRSKFNFFEKGRVHKGSKEDYERANVVVVAPKSSDCHVHSKSDIIEPSGNSCGLPVPPKAESPELGSHRALPPEKHRDDEFSDDIIMSLTNDLISELATAIIFDVHRSVKMGYFHSYEDVSEDSQQNYKTVQNPNTDVFGQQLSSLNKQIADIFCSCPVCKRSICALRFAPHLEKCMGMGRTSSRLASKRIAANHSASGRVLVNDLDNSDEENSDDDNDIDWAFPSPKSKKVQSSQKRKIGSDDGDRFGSSSRLRSTGGNTNRTPSSKRSQARSNRLPAKRRQPDTPSGYSSGITNGKIGSETSVDDDGSGNNELRAMSEFCKSNSIAAINHSSFTSDLFRDGSLFSSETADGFTPPDSPCLFDAIAPPGHYASHLKDLSIGPFSGIKCSQGQEEDADVGTSQGRLTRNSSRQHLKA